MADTEIKLKIWRGDQIGSERMAAAILLLDGFSSVDPQCPLGGRDGLKDVLCEKSGWKYVAAAYFPNSEQKFRTIREKFLHDLEGVPKNKADGLVFITNQGLSPSERDELDKLAYAKGRKSLIYHLERLRALLDSPSGYGVRLEFLDIEMSLEEQLSFFSHWNRSFDDRLQAQGLTIIREISKKIDSITAPTESFAQRIHELSTIVQSTISTLGNRAAINNKSSNVPNKANFATSQLTVETLCMLHRALLREASPGAQVGVLRNLKVWIGGPRATPETAVHVPAEPDQVRNLLEKLLGGWRDDYSTVKALSASEKVSRITRFHHRFLEIHPFLDGNGRIARFLLDQQAIELLNLNRPVIVEDRAPYLVALAQADRGDMTALESVITQAIFGVEFVPGSSCQMAGQNCPACKTGIMNVSPDASGVTCNSCDLHISAIMP